MCNTSTIVGNFTGIDGSRGEHVLPRSVNNFPVGFSHGEHVLPNYPTALINSLQPNPNLINNVVQIDQANMGTQQGPIDHANSVTQNVNTSYANEIQISSGSGLISKPTQSTRDVIQTSDIDRASMSPQVSYSPIIAVDNRTQVQDIIPRTNVVLDPIVTHQPISINRGPAAVNSVSVTLDGQRSSARVYNAGASRLIEQQQQRPNYGINLPVYNAVNQFPGMDDNTARALYNQNAMQLQGYCNPFGVLNPFMLPQQGMFTFPTGFPSQSRIDRGHSDTTVTSVPIVTSQPTSVVSSGTRSTARSIRPTRAVQSGRRTPAAAVSDQHALYSRSDTDSDQEDSSAEDFSVTSDRAYEQDQYGVHEDEASHAEAVQKILFSMQPVTNLVCKLEIRRRRKNNKVALSALGVLVWIEIFMILSCLCQMTSSGKEIDLPK